MHFKIPRVSTHIACVQLLVENKGQYFIGVRGANDRNKRMVLKFFIKTQKVDLVCIQETKIQDVSLGVVQSLRTGRFIEWGVVNARGASEGIVVFWDSRVLELVGMEVGVYSISCQFKNCDDGFVWFFTGVYGPTQRVVREDFWAELGAIRGLWNGLCWGWLQCCKIPLGGVF